MKKLLLLIVTTFALSCCDNDDKSSNQLPPMTQTGANTFGAIINGKVMIPRNSIGYIPPGSSHNPVLYTESDNWEEISASDRKATMGGIYIYIQNTEKKYPLKTGNYVLGDSNGALSNSFAENTLITANVYDKNGKAKIYLSIANTGSITLTKSNDVIISGVFSCKLKSENSLNDIIEIKEGRFDFNKNTINSTDFK